MRRALAVLAILLLAGCSTADAGATQRGHPLPRSIVITPAPRPTPTASPAYLPGPSSLGGAIRAIHGPRLILGTVDDEVAVDLDRARSIWRETEVDASALQVGDDLSLNGAWSDGVFVVAYAWANIGRIDGVICAIDGDVLSLDATVRVGVGFGIVTRRVELSRYVTFVAPLTRSDLRPGRTIGAVLYAPRTGLPRLTRVW